jgi:hypothetical protein
MFSNIYTCICSLGPLAAISKVTIVQKTLLFHFILPQFQLFSCYEHLPLFLFVGYWNWKHTHYILCPADFMCWTNELQSSAIGEIQLNTLKNKQKLTQLSIDWNPKQTISGVCRLLYYVCP